ATVFRRSMVRDLSMLAEVIGDNCTAALEFDDRHAAEETVGALRADPHVVAACVYGRDGRPFAAYDRDGAPAGFSAAPAGIEAERARFGGGVLSMYRPIRLEAERIGTTYIEADLRELDARMVRYVGIFAVVALVSTAVSLGVAARLQRVISQPILELT